MRWKGVQAPPAGEIPPGEDLAPHYKILFGMATKNIRMIMANLRPHVLEKPEILQVLDERMKFGRVNVDIIFNKFGAHTEEEVLEAMKKDNPGIIDLKAKHPRRLKLYWADQMLDRSSAFADTKRGLVENPENLVGFTA